MKEGRKGREDRGQERREEEREGGRGTHFDLH